MYPVQQNNPSGVARPWGVLESLLPEGALPYWEQEMVGRGYLVAPGTGMVRPEMLKAGAKDDRDNMVMRTIVKYMYEFAYNPDEPKDLYIRKKGNDCLFERVPTEAKELRDMVTTLYDMFFGKTPHTETKACFENVKDNVKQAAMLNNGLWYAGGDLFWDSEKSELITKDALGGRSAYREIGGTSRTKGVDAEVIKESFDRWTQLLEEKTKERGDFERFYRELPMEFEYIKTWAHPTSVGFIDKYWDLNIAASTIFMYNQPPIAYMEQGNPRGGKSTYNKMLHFIVGNWQTSRVDLPGLADWSFNNVLFGSLLNAPDEDPAEKLKPNQTAAFKSLAAKEEYDVPVKNSAIPKKVKPKFMMFIPKNSPPSFGADSDACMTRLKFIFFTNDLSKLDHKPVDFVKETFIDHPDTLAKYVGFILALTRYFEKRGMWYSPTMVTSNDYVAESTNSTKIYYNMWKRFYVGYESFDLLWKDYVNFCQNRGYECETKEVLRQRFMMEAQNRVKKYYPGIKKEIWMYLGSENYSAEMYKQGLLILCRSDFIKGYGDAEDYVLNGVHSFVDIRNRILEDALWDNKQKEHGQVEMEV